jgi:tRNA G18 (ribose-2'-O)-methylase SpoU
MLYQDMSPSEDELCSFLGGEAARVGASTLDASNETASCNANNSPGSYLIVFNVSKRHNIGTLVRSATAFGVTEVMLLHLLSHSAPFQCFR